jgi:chromosome segregation ATPase
LKTKVAKFLYDSHLAITKLPADQKESGTEGLGWDELVAQKRKLSNDLKVITEKIIDIDKNQFNAITAEIREARANMDRLKDRLHAIDNEVEKNNASLYSISEKISQAKNFLSVMEARLPPESEEVLQKIVQENELLLSSNSYRTEREKNEIMSKSKEASMKLEAIKATRTIRDQFSILTQETSKISALTQQLDTERNSTRNSIAETNSTLDRLYDGKRKLTAERESGLAEYDRIAREFDLINARLDSMSEMRRKQREEYGHGLPSDALFKVKETARKKLEAGGKLTFEELKLLYGEKD